ncbi:hypothetical protein FO519_001211 [Halicephalobus sp. NKZ332]|nr:hypothetical protein FO519_001211 [Halicephalobus sp. NKZ332]
MENDSVVLQALHKGIGYWSPIFLGNLGGLMELIIVIFLFYEFSKRKSDVKSAYFFILSLGFIVNILMIATVTMGEFINWSRDYMWIIKLSTFFQWYGQLSSGPWHAVLGLNRCTALGYPILHHKLWSGTSLGVISVMFILAPIIINSYSFVNFDCMIDSWDPDCVYYLQGSMFVIAGATTFFCFLTLFLVGLGVFKSRSNLSSKLNVEKRLIWQTVVGSSLLIVYFGLQAWVATAFFTDIELFNNITAIGNYIMLLQRYPTIIILFIVRQV